MDFPVAIDMVRRIRRKWPEVTIHGGLTEAWRGKYVRRGDYLIQRCLEITMHGKDQAPDVTLTIESDEAGNSKITEVRVSHPGGVGLLSVENESGTDLMVAALTHTMLVRVGPDSWEGVTTTKQVVDAIRRLSDATTRRKVVTEDHLREVAKVYLEAVAEGDPHPTKAVAMAFSRARPTAAGWVVQARKLGLIPPAKQV